MKKYLICVVFLLITCSVLGQDNYFKYNGVADVLFRYKERGEGGRAFVADQNNTLTINFNNDFHGGVIIGGFTSKYVAKFNMLAPYQIEFNGSTKINSKLDVNGTIHSKNVVIDDVTPVLSMTYTQNGSAAIRSNNNTWVMGILGNSGSEDVSLGSQGGEGNRTLTLAAGGRAQLKILSNGNIGIGTLSPTSKLDVNGTIRSKEVKIEATGWSDFVFDEKYQLPSLSEVENHIKEHKHLRDIPSEREVIENGISVGEMQAKLLQKIEELTLYVIEQDKKIESLQKENALIKNDFINLKK